MYHNCDLDHHDICVESSAADGDGDNPGVLLHGHKQGRGGDGGGVHGLLHLEQQLHEQPPGPALDQPRSPS